MLLLEPGERTELEKGGEEIKTYAHPSDEKKII